MAKKKSRFQELLAATKDTLTPSVPELEPIVDEVNPIEVLHELESASAQKEEPKEVEVVEDLGVFNSKEQKEANEKLVRSVIHPDSRKAYNIWYSNVDKAYYMDVIEYDKESVLEFTSEKLTVSQALAMAKAKQIFSDKLILKKKGV